MTHAILTLLLAIAPAITAPAETALPVLKTTRSVVSIREGETLHRDSWRLSPQVSPDLYEVEVKAGRPQSVVFITDVDSMRFTVEVGTHYDFIIQHGDDRCLTRIAGIVVPPAAVFDAEYRSRHSGVISIEVPEVYELVNIALAMTDTGIHDRNLVYHDSEYYAAMRTWFDPFNTHPAIAALDSALRLATGLYFDLKMNGNSFELDHGDRLVHSRIYDRTAYPGERSNALRPFIGLLESFARDSRFREFYRQHQAVYSEQIAFYRDTAHVGAMRAWLNRNFPAVKAYDSYKILFSPLVAYNQSATWLESNGFKELQAHVNYPYPRDVDRFSRGATLSAQAATILRGDIVFTELNHGYINPEADLFADRVRMATSRREYWVDPARGPNYYAGISAFNEYMNWALVSLRMTDVAPAAEQQTLIATVDNLMTNSRGFPQFAAFDSFLVDLYRHRQSGQTVADFYPRIID